MEKKLYFGSNFKMYKNIQATEAYLQAITDATSSVDRRQIQFFFIPSFTSLESASNSSVRDKFMLGAQNIYRRNLSGNAKRAWRRFGYDWPF